MSVRLAAASLPRCGWSLGWTPYVGDWDADGDQDLLLHAASTGQAFQMLSNGVGGFSVGGTVTWNNTSGVQHDVDFGTGSAQHIAVWEAGSRSLTFSSPGTFMYFCNLHAGMTGTIVVR